MLQAVPWLCCKERVHAKWLSEERKRLEDRQAVPWLCCKVLTPSISLPSSLPPCRCSFSDTEVTV